MILNEPIQVACDSCKDTWMCTVTATFAFTGQSNLDNFSIFTSCQWTSGITRACSFGSFTRHANVAAVNLNVSSSAFFVADDWILDIAKWTNMVVGFVWKGIFKINLLFWNKNFSHQNRSCDKKRIQSTKNHGMDTRKSCTFYRSTFSTDFRTINCTFYRLSLVSTPCLDQ